MSPHYPSQNEKIPLTFFSFPRSDKGPKQVAQLGVKVGKTSRFTQGCIVTESLTLAIKTKPSKIKCLLPYLSEREGPQDRVLILPPISLHLRDPASGGWAVAGALWGEHRGLSPAQLRLCLWSVTCCALPTCQALCWCFPRMALVGLYDPFRESYCYSPFQMQTLMLPEDTQAGSRGLLEPRLI